MRLVVDASVLAEVLIGSPRGQSARPELAGRRAQVPELVFIEVASVLRRWTRAGLVTPVRASQALADLAVFPADQWPHTPLLPRIWSLKDNISAYDATYVSLAETLRCPLLTADARLARTVRTLGVCDVLEIG